MSQIVNRTVRRVLLVDDDPLVVKVYTERMRFEGWTVAVARDAWEAGQEAKRERFDVILLDIRMPLGDGLEVLRDIRRGERNADTPIWILTSLSEGEQLDDAMRLGADGVFHKSNTRPDDLVKELGYIFRSGRSVGSREPAPAPAAAAARRAPEPEHVVEDYGDPDEIFDEEEWGEPARPAAAAPATPAEGDDHPPTVPIPAPRAPKGPSAAVGGVYSVHVNPFLGDGAGLCRDLGLPGSYLCPLCKAALCLRLTAEMDEEGHQIIGRFVCTGCEEMV